MPPNAKFTRQAILDAALDIVRNNGESELTVRAIAKNLGSSVCPIFTVFKNMEELRGELVVAARAVYSEYVKEGLKDTPSFYGVGKQYVAFAIKEPRLFQLLFMSEQEKKPNVNGVLPIIEANYDEILQSVEDSYGVGREDALKIYTHLWIYSHGIAALCATNTCAFTIDEINELLGKVGRAVVKDIKGVKN